MSLTEGGKWLVVVLGKRLAMSVVTDEPSEAFTAFNTRYHRREVKGIKATYDRLLDETGGLVGLQVWPVPSNAADLVERLPKAPYLQFPGGVPCFQIFFSGAPVPNPESGGEQALSAEIYEGHSGDLAMSFDLSEILDSDAEVALIREADTHVALR